MGVKETSMKKRTVKSARRKAVVAKKAAPKRRSVAKKAAAPKSRRSAAKKSVRKTGLQARVMRAISKIFGSSRKNA